MQLNNTHKKDLCGEDTVTDRMCQKWFEKFYAGDFSLDNVSGSSRSVEDQLAIKLRN